MAYVFVMIFTRMSLYRKLVVVQIREYEDCCFQSQKAVRPPRVLSQESKKRNEDVFRMTLSV